MAAEDILIGPVTVYRAPVGETIPDETTVAYGAAWGGNWEDMGYTAEDTPLSWNLEVERVEVGAQQTTLTVKVAKTREKLALETTLLEFTGDNVAVAMGGTLTETVAGVGQVGLSEVKGGGGFDVDLYAWGFEGRYVDAQGSELPVRLFVHKGFGGVAGALEFGKEAATGIPFRIDAVEDRSQTAGERLYHIQIVTAPATS